MGIEWYPWVCTLAAIPSMEETGDELILSARSGWLPCSGSMFIVGKESFIVFGIWKRIKASVKKYLEHLSEENQREFGDGAPDCCKLNRTQNKKTGQ